MKLIPAPIPQVTVDVKRPVRHWPALTSSDLTGSSSGAQKMHHEQWLFLLLCQKYSSEFSQDEHVHNSM